MSDIPEQVSKSRFPLALWSSALKMSSSKTTRDHGSRFDRLILPSVCLILLLAMTGAAYQAVVRLDSFSITPFGILALRGEADSFQSVDIYGQNPDVDTGTVPEDIWAVGGTYTYLAAATVLRVYSSDANDTAAGTGARTATLTCLNADYDQFQETITFNGVTPVNSVGSCLRLVSLIVATAGTGGANAGTLSIDSGAATPLLGSIAPGNNRTLLSHYTIPNRFTGYVKRIYFNARQGDSGTIRIVYRPQGGVFVPLRELEVIAGHVAVDLDYIFTAIPAKADVKMVITRSQNINSVFAGGYGLQMKKT